MFRTIRWVLGILSIVWALSSVLFIAAYGKDWFCYLSGGALIVNTGYVVEDYSELCGALVIRRDTFHWPQWAYRRQSPWGLIIHEIPLWPIPAMFCVSMSVPVIRPLIRYFRRKHCRCAQCGYDLRGNPTHTCPECGSIEE